MHTRREFLQRAALLSGATFAMGSLSESILAAARIEPMPGSSYLDAEHIVILMQENRSFDHAFGALKGVRGFNDPRAFVLPNGNPVWLQTNREGKTYAPFRFDIKDTNITWIGGLPHGWTDQVDARAGGRYDTWLDVKRSGHPSAKDAPMTLGYYSREDIPFYYALADAFTVCDQNFCSSLTGTTPNRSFLWTGTVRPTKDGSTQAAVRNGELDYGAEATWTTFPERLEDLGISWKIYQNEISLDSGLKGEEDAWLSNFTDNPIEWFSQYNVRLAKGHLAYLNERQKELEKQSSTLSGDKADKAKKELAELIDYRKKWNQEAFDKLDARSKSIHEKAFCSNDNDPNYRDLTKLEYDDEGTKRSLMVPKGDVLHQFRSDVEGGKLPAVSWLVPSEHYSDHPGSAWFGAWYLAEVLDILTKNPDVWKKTIFVLTYDENDGWFDHVPPFVAPRPGHPETGKVSEGIDTSGDYVELAQDREREDEHSARGSSIGLGYRVPMVIASPWSRGGAVCSQVFDHSSVIQLAEVILSHKLGKKVREDNITDWRRCVSGNLTSVFREANDGDPNLPFFDQNEFLELIHKAQFKRPMSGFKEHSVADVAAVKAKRRLGGQEPGTKPSCPLPYELYVDEVPGDDLTLNFRVGSGAGAPFNAALYGDNFVHRSYAVAHGKTVEDHFSLGSNRLRVDGPNGFLREYAGKSEVVVGTAYRPNGDLRLQLENKGKEAASVLIKDLSYGLPDQKFTIPAGARFTADVAANKTQGWYDVQVKVSTSANYERRLAGRVETGKWSITDPAMA